MADVVAARQQLLEVNKATVMYSDWELAYDLQLEEAMAASAMDVPPVKSQIREGKRPVEESFVQETLPKNSLDKTTLDVRDRFSALGFQSAELQILEEILGDQKKAAKEAQDLIQEFRMRSHDRQFAKSVDEMPDTEWEEEGDIYEEPFHGLDDDYWDENQVCKLYTGRAREEPGHVAMAWSLRDAEGHVLVESGKYLGMGTAAYVAEYTALIEGLSYAVAAGVKNIQARCNCVFYKWSLQDFLASDWILITARLVLPLLLLRQVSGLWKARAPKHIKLLEEVFEHTKQLKVFNIRLTSRRTVENLAHDAIRKHVTQGPKDIKRLKPSSSGFVTTPEETDMIDCPVCLENVREADTFVVQECLHRFCVSCLTQHVQIRVKSNQVPVKCPQDCSRLVDVEQCRNFLPPDLVELYTKSLIEASIPESERVYCPFTNCSALMSKGDLNPSSRPSSSRPSSSRQPKSFAIGQVECMECHRLFCVECQVPWHADMSCEDYNNLPPDGRAAEDIKLYKLASNKNWQRCTKCRRMIELDQGCYHMTCSFGSVFILPNASRVYVMDTQDLFLKCLPLMGSLGIVGHDRQMHMRTSLIIVLI
ncbi:hypothetical protein AXG93_3582s1080 [Marchantia polymorpha subsp. ruderalis]|uniref:RBR-type E3 ubiquitin transferase n=1 Tax=Marchantia polymorpha subsp. ruderalis TaxID=1480154 RepID=A0A176W2K6_MARPO|nr:hypothetical protein AXG93_3582s1080 [Marchantia polymorpha subsp. ruderalis]